MNSLLRALRLGALLALSGCQNQEPVVVKRTVALESPAGLTGADGQPFAGRAIRVASTPDGLDRARTSTVFVYPLDPAASLGPSTWLIDGVGTVTRATFVGPAPTGHDETTSPPDGGTLWFEVGGEVGAAVDLYFTQEAATCVEVKLRRRRCSERGEPGCDQLNARGFEDGCELP